MRLLLAADDPNPGPGPWLDERDGACRAGTAAARKDTHGATAGSAAGGKGPHSAGSGAEQLGSGGALAVPAGGSDDSGSSLQYMLGWYSLIAPALGLPMPLALWTG